MNNIPSLKIILLLAVVILIVLMIFTTTRYCIKWVQKAADRRHHKKYLEEKAKILQLQQEKYQELEEDQQQTGLDFTPPEEKIVAIAEPIGKWTRMIVKEKFGYLRAIKEFLQQKNSSSDSKKGFWQIMIEAKAGTQGRYQGKNKGR